MKPDESQIEQMINDNRKLVYFILHKQFPSLIGDDDIEQYGLIGLWKACKNYDSDKSKFATFATRCIRNEILMELRRRKTQQKTEAVSLDMPISVEGKEDAETSLMETLRDPDDKYAELEYDLKFLEDIASGREIEVLDMSMSGYSQIEIAEYFKVSRSYISRILDNVRKKIAKEYNLII